MGFRGKKATYPELAQAAWANFRLASDDQLKSGCGLKRSAVKTILERVLPSLECDRPRLDLDDDEARTLVFLADRFIWKPAFTGDEVFRDFCGVLEKNKIVIPEHRPSLLAARSFLLLYAMIRMHGTAIMLKDGTSALLLCGFANRYGLLEVKVQIEFTDGPKPISSPVCMFLTDLRAEDYCDAPLLASSSNYHERVWHCPLEINVHGKLCRVTERDT